MDILFPHCILTFNAPITDLDENCLRGSKLGNSIKINQTFEKIIIKFLLIDFQPLNTANTIKEKHPVPEWN